MSEDQTTYCGKCAEPILSQWKGWPHKDAIPLLPRSINNSCEKCGSNVVLESSQVHWVNIHGENNTGLPDYWGLVVGDVNGCWGLPYYSEGICPSCNNRAVISQMKYPNGRDEFKCNCQYCGVVNWS